MVHLSRGDPWGWHPDSLVMFVPMRNDRALNSRCIRVEAGGTLSTWPTSGFYGRAWMTACAPSVRHRALVEFRLESTGSDRPAMTSDFSVRNAATGPGK